MISRLCQNVAILASLPLALFHDFCLRNSRWTSSMHKLRPAIVAVLTLLTCEGVASADPPHGFVSGVWQKGHNITEPRPKSSKLIKVVEAGFLFSLNRPAVPGWPVCLSLLRLSESKPCI